MSASSVHSLASTQDDDVASIEWGVRTAACFMADVESRLLALSVITTPVGYEDADVSEKSTTSPHPAPHLDSEEEEETVEVARGDGGNDQECTIGVQEPLLLHESKATIQAECGGGTVAGSAASELTPYHMAPFPMVYCTEEGSISCVLNHDVVVEMAVDRSVRVVLPPKFAAFCNERSTLAAICHPSARIVQTEEIGGFVYAKFIANNEKMAVLSEQDVIFTMSHLTQAYLVNAAFHPGVKAGDKPKFPSLAFDTTFRLFEQAQTGPQFQSQCKILASAATYECRPDGSLYIHINGMQICQSTSGDVVVDAGPRQISCSPSKMTIHVKGGSIDMAVEEEECGYVKRAGKRFAVSRTGMIISDDNCTTSMDPEGRIVCCTY